MKKGVRHALCKRVGRLWGADPPEVLPVKRPFSRRQSWHSTGRTTYPKRRWVAVISPGPLGFVGALLFPLRSQHQVLEVSDNESTCAASAWAAVTFSPLTSSNALRTLSTASLVSWMAVTTASRDLSGHVCHSSEQDAPRAQLSASRFNPGGSGPPRATDPAESRLKAERDGALFDEQLMVQPHCLHHHSRWGSSLLKIRRPLQQRTLST
jgi:hypothetical protein